MNPKVAIAGYHYTFDGPAESWAIGVAPDRSAFQCEIRTGFKDPRDAARSRPFIRAEVRAAEPFPDEVSYSFSVRILDTTLLPTRALMFHQIKQEVTGIRTAPALRFDALQGQMRIRTTGQDAPYERNITSSVTRYSGPPMQSGRWEWFLVNARFHPTAGRLSVWRNRERILNIDDIPLGYRYDNPSRAKFGLYGEEQVERLTAQFSHIERGFKPRFSSARQADLMPTRWPSLEDGLEWIYPDPAAAGPG